MHRFVKRATLVAAAGATVAGFLIPTASSASAAPAAKTNLKLALVGSDTTVCVDKALTAAYNPKVATTTGNHIYNVPSIGGVNVGCGTFPLTYKVPADSVHGALNFANPAVPPTTGAPPGPGHLCAQPLSSVAMPWEFPDGSSLGITCYTDDNGAGNLAFSRSSRGRGSTDPAGLQFWADSLDALTWSSNSTHAPKSMSAKEIRAIINCTDTTWGQVNGNPSDKTPISVWFPQLGSGTASFFSTVFLGGVEPSPSSCLPASHFVEENTGSQVTGKNAFYPYSFGDYTAQTNGTETNVTNGFKLHAVSGTLPSFTTISEAAAKTNVTGDACNAPKAGQFCASRYLYHTVWKKVPAKVFSAAISFMGVPATGVAAKTSVCSNAYASILKKYGFKPLRKAKTGQATSSNPVPGSSFCRQF